ncbi:MAG: tetratricopeptide repeat protein [Bacteroidetes bacterium]|nr:tetratricopeptide repeat protein [Bacteroidota bacterium]MBU1718201.1 tetratricopeptide repeat protein [Bacteroidota bacterium]
MKYTGKKIFFLLCLILPVLHCSGQNRKLDSLKAELQISVEDTNRVNLLNEIFKAYYSSEPLTAVEYEKEALKLSRKLKFQNGESKALNNIGVVYYFLGNYKDALNYYEQSLAFDFRNHDKPGLAKSLGNIGSAYFKLGDYEKALDFNKRSLVIKQEINDSAGIGKSLNNIGGIYNETGDYEKALDYYFQSLKLKEVLNERAGIAMTLSNIAFVYQRWKKHSQALKNFERALDLYRQINDRIGEATTLGSMGNCYYDQEKYEPALMCFQKSLVIRTDIGDERGIGILQGSMGKLYCDLKLYDKAIEANGKAIREAEADGNRKGLASLYNNMGFIYSEKGLYSISRDYFVKSLSLAEEIGSLDGQVDVLFNLGNVLGKLGRYEEAFYYNHAYIRLKDSIFGLDNTRLISQMDAIYQTEKKQQEIALLNKEAQVSQLLLKEQADRQNRQQLLLYGAGAIMLVILVFVYFLLRLIRHIRKANVLLNRQKNEILEQRDEIKEKGKVLKEAFDTIEMKNRNITDSIRYAKRIQEAILPPLDRIRMLLPDSFVLYMPKDIVSGDFYWVEKAGDKVLFAAVDCTGHGVPGAFMSIVGHNLLDQALHEQKLTAPGEILDFLNKTLATTLHPGKDEETVKDAMDLALCAYNPQTRILEYAGAYNPLYIVRQQDMITQKADKHPVGYYGTDSTFRYQTQTIQLEAGDKLYVCSDGYIDQIGGPNRKRFLSSRLKKLLLDIHHLPFAEQKQLLVKNFHDWKGSIEQYDDILLMGVGV